MPQRLHSVLSSVDLPTAELWAARLDGELFRLGDCFTPIDEVEQPAHRARVVHSALTATAGDIRMIAEQHSAAWIWGAIDVAPTRHQLCVGIDSRAGRDLTGTVTVREVVIEPREYETIDGFRVTTVLRTIIDLARFSETFESHDAQIVSVLMRSSGVTFDGCVRELDRRRNLPGKRRARERLSRC